MLLPAQVDLFAGIAGGRGPGTGNRAEEISEGIWDLVFEVFHPAERHARCAPPVVAEGECTP